MTGVTEANKMMNALRMGGIDATILDTVTGVKHRNWAANANGQVMPMLVANSAYQANYVIKCDSLQKRKHNWISIENLRRELGIQVSIKPTGYVTFMNGVLLSNRGQRYRPIRSMPRPMVEAEAATFVITTNDGTLNYRYSDFLMAEKAVPPDAVERPVVPLGTTALLSTEQRIEEDGPTSSMADLQEHVGEEM
jgi:hypothetical protein